MRNYLGRLRENGFAVRFGMVFGSQATGCASEWSDIDLLVVSPRFDREIVRRDVELLWSLAARTDSRIEPIPCGEKQWLEDDSMAIVEIARRWGEPVPMPDEPSAN